MALRALPALLAATSLLSFSHCASAGSWPRVSHLRDGSTISVWQNGRVVQRDRHGALLAESYCGSYTRYRRWVGFMSSFRTGVLTRDRALVARSVAFPFRWNHGRPGRSTVIADRAELLRDYSAIFSAGVVRTIRAADPRALFCRDVSMVMLGSGVVWGDEPGGRPAVVSINTPA